MMWDATPMILAAVRNGRFTGLPLASSSETRRAAQSAFEHPSHVGVFSDACGCMAESVFEKATDTVSV